MSKYINVGPLGGVRIPLGGTQRVSSTASAANAHLRLGNGTATTATASPVKLAMSLDDFGRSDDGESSASSIVDDVISRGATAGVTISDEVRRKVTEALKKKLRGKR